MNLLLLQPDEVPQANGQVGGEYYGTITGIRVAQMMEEHGLVAGISITAGIVDGQIGQAQILTVSDETVKILFSPQRAPPPKLPVTLAVGYSRPQASKRVMQLAAQAGVRSLHFFPTATSQKSYQQSTVFQEGELRYQLGLGLQQGCDTVFPNVTLWGKWYEFERWLGQTDTPQKRYVADTNFQGTVSHNENGQDETLFIIGAEQGFTEDELARFRNQNCASVTLGPRILKVDVACAFLLGGYLAGKAI